MVEGSDVATAVTGTCPDRVITVRGVPVIVNSGTMFGPGMSCSTLVAGMTVHIRGLLTVTAGPTPSSRPPSAWTSSRLKAAALAAAPKPADPAEAPAVASTSAAKARSRISSGTCPALSMVVRGTRVRTSAATEFVDGACGNLRNGTKVDVQGDTNGDGGLDATRIRIVDQPGGGGQGRTTGEGTVSAVRGTCPTLTMVIRGYAVMTSEATTYVGGSCSSLRAGAKVVVTGVNQANSLMAEKIEFKD